jgi:hypothetical protein
METNNNITSIPTPSSNMMSEFVKAMILAQSDFSVPVLDKSGNRNKYASIKSIFNATLPHLRKHGLLFSQHEVYNEENKCTLLETRVTHISGGFINSTVKLEVSATAPGLSDAQKYGCALSYARRYSAMNLLGLYADEEDMDDYDHKEEEVPRKDVDAVINKINMLSTKDLNIKVEAQKILGTTKSVYDISRIQYQKFIRLVQ